MKMPEPITAPIPMAVRLHGPKVRRSFFSGSSEAAMSASILFVRKMLTVAAPECEFPALSACAGPEPGDGSFSFRRRALQFLAFNGVGEVLRIHQFLFNPAYFSINFFNP